MELTEEKIQLIKDDPRFFGIVYEKYVKEIFAYAYHLSGNRHKSEDLVSMAFMRALEKIDKFDGNEKQLRSWLYTITRNIFIDEVRKKKNNQNLNISIDYELSDDENLSRDQEIVIMMEEVVKFIENLEPPIYAEVLILRYKQELDISEIAEVIEKTEQNVRTILHRATKKLTEIYEGAMGDLSV